MTGEQKEHVEEVLIDLVDRLAKNNPAEAAETLPGVIHGLTELSSIRVTLPR